jgi:hypothetical protein
MSFVDTVTNEKPGKYETIIESRVLAKQLEMKIKQYHSTQDAYDKLIQSETINRKPASGGNENINGRLKQISAAGKDWLWGVNSSDNIFTCKKPCTDSNWKQIPGGLTQIEGGDKEVWGVAADKTIYKTNQDGTDGWSNIPGKLTNISQGGGWVWGVNSSNNVYRCKDPCDGNWVLDTTPSSEWTLVFRQTNNNWNWTTNNGGNRNSVNNNAANYSQLQNLENFRGDDGKLTFKMTYPKNNTLTSPQIWKQTSNPWTVRNNRSGQVDGYQAISVPYTGDAWGGLRWNGGPCLLSGSTNSWWWYALGSFKPFGNNLIPGANATQVNKTELYVKNNKITPSLVQLSCSNTYVYGLDTNKNAWWKPINGTGSWKRFGNDNQKKWQFYWINASSSNGKILALDMDRRIRETDKNGTAPWNYSSSAGGASGLTTVSADSSNEDFYFTNTNDQIYRNSPITSGGLWTDIKNENYQMGMVSSPTQTNDNWKFLGKSDTLNDCKLKAVEDKETAYSSVVYYPSDFGNDWSKSCFGGIKGKNINSGYQLKTITSLAPNGTSRLGGQEGETLLNQMKKIQGQIKSLIDQSKEDSIGLDKTTNSLNTTRKTTNNELSNLLDKLARDRKKINKLLLEPDAIGEEENSDFLQQTNYSVYFLWILLVIVSLFLASHIIGSPSESISPIAYAFVGIWILIFAKYYYKQAASYGVAFWNYISAMLVDPL